MNEEMCEYEKNNIQYYIFKNKLTKLNSKCKNIHLKTEM